MTDFAFLEGKTVFVVGGASGLGASAAVLAQEAGAKVVVFDISPSEVGAYRPVDLRDEASIRNALDETGECFDFLVSFAGLPPGAVPASILQVNYLGQVQFLEGLLGNANEGAGVISIASIGGREWRKHDEIIVQFQAISDLSEVPAFTKERGIDGKAAYRLSKAALIRWTRQMAFAHPRNEVSFLAVSPGPVNTELFKRAAKNSPEATADLLSAAPRIAEPEEIAKAIIGLCRPEFHWLNGVNIPLDGGADARFDAMGLNMNITFEEWSEEQ
ncbi:MAG: SDR family oxidoreductase [Boseongicola sp.]|nr:SDR family oxidoreductase [Boseongicola sp.]